MFRLLLAVWLLGAAPAWAATCDLPAPGAVLLHLKAALARRQLSLLVIAPAGTNGDSLPSRIRASLQAQRPDLSIDLDTLDNTGQSVSDMLPGVATRLAQRPLALVVWQAGTAETFRNSSAASIASSLADAARLVATYNADLLLIDPDPTPSLDAAANFPLVLAGLAQSANHPGIALYSQHNLNAPTACVSHGIAHLIAGS
jgi:hypothetical protein